MSETKTTEYEAAYAAGERAAEAQTPPDAVVSILAVPPGTRIASMEPFRATPLRKRGTAVFTHESGFTAYLKTHIEGSTTLFASMDVQAMTAVIDYHGKDGPSWGEHRATFIPPKDDDWLIWEKHNDAAMSQIDFTQFVEDNLPLIVDPPSAELLEMVQHLEAHTSVKFKSANRMKDGSKALVYEETVQGGVGKGQIEIPDEIAVRLPVFRWGDKVEMTAKLRYRIAEGKLALWYHLHRPQDAIDGAFKRLLDGVEVATALKPHFGNPPSVGEMAARA